MLFNIRYNLIYNRSDELCPSPRRFNMLLYAKSKKHAYMIFTNMVNAVAINNCDTKIKVTEIEDA